MNAIWPSTRVAELLRIRLPIIQAPMAGGPSTPELAAATSNAGGLGSLAVGYLEPEKIRSQLESLRDRTTHPFAVNVFAPESARATVPQLERMAQRLAPYHSELGLPQPTLPSRFAPDFDAQMEAVMEGRPAVVSFTFGVLPPEWVKRLHTAGVLLLGTATTVREAVELERAGIDLVVAQGSEAGGHRGSFLADAGKALVGTSALVPQIVDRVRVPVIAAGGIGDGRGIVAALALGAEGVQLGTSFLTTRESGAHPEHKRAVLCGDDESTSLTRAFSGKWARGISNRFMDELAGLDDQDMPPYPAQNALTRDLRSAAAKQNRPDLMSLWAGQSAALARDESVAELLQRLERETLEVMARFAQ